MQQALAHLAAGTPVPGLLDFRELCRVVGFEHYNEAAARYVAASP